MSISHYEPVETFRKTYGIRASGKRYLILCDGRTTSSGLSYSNAEFALRKAESFCKSIYQDWKRDNGSLVHFTFTRQDS